MQSPDAPESLKPPWLQLPLELRAFFEARHAPASNAYVDWPKGHQRPIFIIPGFGQSDDSTAALRSCLKHQGFLAYDWGQGRNQGLKPGMTARLLQRISDIHGQHQQSVTLIGWSLGGIIARELARKSPNHIARVITLGSPIAGPQATTIQAVFSLINRNAKRSDGFNPKRYQPPPVPCTAIYTKQDGIVNWRASLEPSAQNSENIEVSGSHLALGFNPQVWHAICHRCSPDTAKQPYK